MKHDHIHHLRFGRKVLYYTINKKTGCWENVMRHRDKDGYPQIRESSLTMTLHRYVYKKINGDIPSTTVVRHTCDVPHCINPQHLIAGTQADNMRDRDQRGRGPVGEHNGRAKLTPIDVIHIREHLKAALNELAEQYDVKVGTIADAAGRKLWKHVA